MKNGAFSKYSIRFVMYAFLIVVSLLSVFPLYWAFISAFNNTQQILGGRMIPSNHLIENLKNLFAQQDVWNAMKNSFATSLLQTFLALAVSSIAGYGFEIYHDKYKDGLMGILMLAMMVPFVAVLVPLFQMMSKAKLLNTWIGFFIPSLLYFSTCGGYIRGVNLGIEYVKQLAEMFGINNFEKVVVEVLDVDSSIRDNITDYI